MIVWIDLETTGLNPNTERVLEVACIITDDQLNEVARYEAVTNEIKNVHLDLGRVNEHVLKMHVENGLWNESLLSDKNIMLVDSELTLFIKEHAPQTQLAGSTISFDRSFLERHLPVASSKLHYRNIDVTSFNEIARRMWPEIHDGRPRSESIKHRAMADIEESLNVMRYYVSKLGPING